jgi:uncharacterized membrane-anchored protein YhcB (DUF1043 family)
MDQMLIIVGLLSLAAGLVVGYYVAELRAGAKASEIKKAKDELDQYRQKVTDHFSETSEHFRAIGQQYRALHEHVVSGATELCDPSRTNGELMFTPTGMLEKTVDESAESGGAVHEQDEDIRAADAASHESAPAIREPEDAVDPDGIDDDLQKPPAAAPDDPSSKAPASAAPEADQPAERTLH